THVPRETPTVVEKKQDGKAKRGGGQEDKTDVAGDHEVADHQGDFVLGAVLMQIGGSNLWSSIAFEDTSGATDT
ncbi:UNVERIFIED_CONTAM: hypothetical protein K2H54_008478, partial [Gekko kuhli]